MGFSVLVSAAVYVEDEIRTNFAVSFGSIFHLWRHCASEFLSLWSEWGRPASSYKWRWELWDDTDINFISVLRKESQFSICKYNIYVMVISPNDEWAQEKARVKSVRQSEGELEWLPFWFSVIHVWNFRKFRSLESLIAWFCCFISIIWEKKGKQKKKNRSRNRNKQTNTA